MDPLTVLGHTASAIGIVSAVIAAYQSWRNRREQAAERARLAELVPVTLRLQSETEPRSHRLPVQVRRGDLTRAEMQGLLGVVPMKPRGETSHPRYQIAYTSTPAFLEDIQRIRAASGPTELVVPLGPEEVDQFAVAFEGPEAE